MGSLAGVVTGATGWSDGQMRALQRDRSVKAPPRPDLGGSTWVVLTPIMYIMSGIGLGFEGHWVPLPPTRPRHQECHRHARA